MTAQLPGAMSLDDRRATASAPGSADRAIFYSAAAQEDNLGDVVIRRIVFQWITQQNDDVHLFRGGMSSSYLAAMKMADSVTVHHSSRSFARAWLRACGGRRADLVYAPGPRTALPTIASTRAAAAMALMTGLTRTSGGAVIAVGGALRGGSSPAMLLHQLTALMCTDYSVRDQFSRDLLRERPRSIPDVAFAGANPADAVPVDPVLAISLRSDRELDLSAIRRLVDGATAAGIRPVIVTQVRRDQPAHAVLAADLGIALCGWTDESHTEQLDRIDQIYRRSVVVYSNRLHACIFGARNAAAIIAPEPTSNGKVHQTLRSVYPCTTDSPDDIGAFLDLTSVGYRSSRADLARHARLAAQSLADEQINLEVRLGTPIAETEASSAS